eukprot:s2374_g5.t1
MPLNAEMRINVDDAWVPAEHVVLQREEDDSQADVSDADLWQVESMEEDVAYFISQLKLTSSVLRATVAHGALWHFGRDATGSSTNGFL